MATAWLEFAEEAREKYPIPPQKVKKRNEFGITESESSEDEEDQQASDEDAEGEHPPNADICRVCRGPATPERPLFHPCLCTGSIKYIHQDCLVQWLKHSGKEFCELCKHRFEFAPIYRHDMPQRLPISDIIGGITWGTVSSLRHWCHLGFVAFMWLILVPICIYRIYRFLFYRSLWSIISFPFDLFSLNNLILDNIYGLLVVFLALVGFISLAWLRDQLLHGGAPAWLARDQRAVDQMRMREAHDSMDLLRIHLEQSSKRARERAKEPDRVTAAAELTELHDHLNVEVKKLQEIHFARFGTRLEALHHRQMELRYELNKEDCEAIVLLKGARKKFYTATEKYKDEKFKDLDNYRKETGDKEGFPSGYPAWPLQYPPGLETGLTRDELLIMELHERPRRELSHEEREQMLEEMENIRKEMLTITKEKFEYQRDVNRALRYSNVKMKKRFEPDYGSGATGFPEEDTDIGISARRLSPEEQDLLLKIWQLKREIRESCRKEREIMGRQHDEDKVEQKRSEVRMNRWYNRLLNRHQDDPLVLMERRRNQFRQRPNLGTALAGLAREPHPAEFIIRDQEELSWSKLLGLDGSFRFLEHVVWLIFLILAIIIAFVYVPYQLGHLTAAIFSIWDWLGIVTWRGVVATFIGYVIAGFAIVGFYYGTNKTKFITIKSLLGQSYVVIKVAMILVVEAGIFPLMCGWWIDICSFTLFGSSMKNRQESLDRATGTVMFLHWLAGMIFIFYLASFVMLLREVLRPGVLWFLRNLNDQNFHPINEMISLPVQRHLRRFIMSCIMFGVCVMLILLVPSRLIPLFFPSFLPYNLTLTGSANPLREVQLELILLQFIVPTLLEHGNCRAGLKFLIKNWAKLAAKIFGLHSYLLDKPQTRGNLVDLHGKVIRYVEYNPDQQDPIYTGPLQVLGPGFAPFKPYLRPKYFHSRVIGFLICTTITAVLFSSMLLITPVAIGRFIMGLFWLTNPPEIYTAAIGLYSLWLLIRLANSLYSYVTEGAVQLMTQVAFWALQALKCVVAGSLLFVVIPLLLGHLVDLFLLSPLRVPTDRTPIFYASTEWALGLMHTKCMCGAIWLTNIGFKQTLDQVYQAGIRNLNLTFVVKEVAWPVILGLSLSIAIPYILFMGVFHDLGVVSYHNALFFYRFFYPFILITLLTITLVLFIIKQSTRLYGHVRNEKYLIGRQLVNYTNTPPPIPVPEEEVIMTTPVQETGGQ